MRHSRTLFVVLAAFAWTIPASGQPAKLDTSRYKALHSSLSADQRAAYERALARERHATRRQLAAVPRPELLDAGDLCTAATGPSTAFPQTILDSTTVGMTNNYDIATTCGTGQTVFPGTGASLDRTYAVRVDANCNVTATAFPDGAAWDLAIYVLQAPGAACTQLPALADPQCVSMDDDGGAGQVEAVSWGAVAGIDYFVIIDGFNGATGTYDLVFSATGCNLVPVELLDLAVD